MLALFTLCLDLLFMVKALLPKGNASKSKQTLSVGFIWRQDSLFTLLTDTWKKSCDYPLANL